MRDKNLKKYHANTSLFAIFGIVASIAFLAHIYAWGDQLVAEPGLIRQIYGHWMFIGLFAIAITCLAICIFRIVKN